MRRSCRPRQILKAALLGALIATTAVAQQPSGRPGIRYAPAVRLAQLFDRDGAYLGVVLTPLNAKKAKELKIDAGTKGALVERIQPGGPAEKAGVKANDVIVIVDGESIDGAGDIGRILRKGDDARKTVNVEVVRDRQRQTLSATVESPRPANEE